MALLDSIDPSTFDFCNAFYVVEKSIEVLVTLGGEDRRIRIDVLHELNTESYSTHAYIKEDLTVQPTYPQSHGEFKREPTSVHLWIDYVDLPWTPSNSADAALKEALSFLRERCRHSEKS